jgi:hypothetical protein
VKPEWLPDEHWVALQRYRHPLRKYDATDGFLLTLVKLHPEYDSDIFRQATKAQRTTYIAKLLGIMKRRDKVFYEAEEQAR